jgi:hypothetical protein
MSEFCYPKCYLIGLPKAGTTALYGILAQAPSVFDCSLKEPNFFLPEGVTSAGVRDIRSYTELYEKANLDGLMTIDASVSYSHFPESLSEILRVQPSAKFIIFVRRPERLVISQFQQMKFGLFEEFDDFEAAWMDRLKNGVPKVGHYQFARDYPRSGAVGTIVQNILEVLPREKVYVAIYEELFGSLHDEIPALCDFLGIPEFEFGVDRVNPAKTPVSGFLHSQILKEGPCYKIFRAVVKAMPGDHVSRLKQFYDRRMVKPIQTRRSEYIYPFLKDFFYEEKKRLEEQVGREIATWWP